MRCSKFYELALLFISKLTIETNRSGETLSVAASEPVEKVDVVSFSGQTVKTFTLNGKKDFTLSLKDLPKEKLVFVFYYM